MRPVSFLLRILFLLFLTTHSTQALPQATTESASLERAGRMLEEGRLTEAAENLERLAMTAGPALPELSPTEEEILLRTIETARDLLAEPVTPRNTENSSAARRVLCLARAYFQEELPLREELLEPMRVEKGIERPGVIGSPKPEYTPEAKEARVSGTIIVKTLIDREGCVRRAQVLKGLPFGLEEATTTALRSWTFTPARYQDQPVAVEYILTVNFQPDDD